MIKMKGCGKLIESQLQLLICVIFLLSGSKAVQKDYANLAVEEVDWSKVNGMWYCGFVTISAEDSSNEVSSCRILHDFRSVESGFTCALTKYSQNSARKTVRLHGQRQHDGCYKVLTGIKIHANESSDQETQHHQHILLTDYSRYLVDMKTSARGEWIVRGYLRNPDPQPEDLLRPLMRMRKLGFRDELHPTKCPMFDFASQ